MDPMKDVIGDLDILKEKVDFDDETVDEVHDYAPETQLIDLESTI